MALPSLISNVLDNYGDTMEKMAWMAYLTNEDAKPLVQTITTARIYNNTTKHLLGSNDDKIEAARLEAVLNISKYVKDHPRASQSDIQKKVVEEINTFKINIQSLV
ncbi:uncharacterized protein [Lepeophtheirus salmonis]|nr:uncharacterized protein LOC121118550 [Lepeophtheirus salmonis]